MNIKQCFDFIEIIPEFDKLCILRDFYFYLPRHKKEFINFKTRIEKQDIDVSCKTIDLVCEYDWLVWIGEENRICIR
jgi:hypothetical protein